MKKKLLFYFWVSILICNSNLFGQSASYIYSDNGVDIYVDCNQYTYFRTRRIYPSDFGYSIKWDYYDRGESTIVSGSTKDNGNDAEINSKSYWVNFLKDKGGVQMFEETISPGKIKSTMFYFKNTGFYYVLLHCPDGKLGGSTSFQDMSNNYVYFKYINGNNYFKLYSHKYDGWLNITMHPGVKNYTFTLFYFRE
jgi:hypothetical protein